MRVCWQCHDTTDRRIPVHACVAGLSLRVTCPAHLAVAGVIDAVAPILSILQAGRVLVAEPPAELFPGEERGESVTRFVCCANCGEWPAEPEGEEVCCDENGEDSDYNDGDLRSC